MKWNARSRMHTPYDRKLLHSSKTRQRLSTWSDGCVQHRSLSAQRTRHKPRQDNDASGRGKVHCSGSRCVLLYNEKACFPARMLMRRLTIDAAPFRDDDAYRRSLDGDCCQRRRECRACHGEGRVVARHQSHRQHIHTQPQGVLWQDGRPQNQAQAAPPSSGRRIMADPAQVWAPASPGASVVRAVGA